MRGVAVPDLHWVNAVDPLIVGRLVGRREAVAEDGNLPLRRWRTGSHPVSHSVSSRHSPGAERCSEGILNDNTHDVQPTSPVGAPAPRFMATCRVDHLLGGSGASWGIGGLPGAPEGSIG